MSFLSSTAIVTDGVPRPFQTLRGMLGYVSIENGRGFSTYVAGLNEGPCLGVNQVPMTCTYVTFYGATTTGNDFTPPQGNRANNNIGFRTVVRNAAPNNSIRFQFVDSAGTSRQALASMPQSRALVQTWVLSATANQNKVFCNGALLTNFGGTFAARAGAFDSQWRLNVASGTTNHVVFAAEVIPEVISDAAVIAHQQNIMDGRSLYLRNDSARWDFQDFPLGPLPGGTVECGKFGMPPTLQASETSPLARVGVIVDMSDLVWGPISL